MARIKNRKKREARLKGRQKVWESIKLEERKAFRRPGSMSK